MKRVILFAVLALIATAAAGQQRYSCDFIPTLPNGWVINCSGALTPPPPVIPPPVTPAPIPVPPPSTAGSLGPQGTSLLHWGETGVVYSYDLPIGPTGGALQQSDHPQTPTEMDVEWTISKVPGDINYWLTLEASRASRGATTYPCGSRGASAGTVVRWSLAGAGHECRVTTSERWYINVRYVPRADGRGCVPTTEDPGRTRCPVSYFHTEY
jgi:hypothetical protein